MSDTRTITITVNGRNETRTVETRRTLADFLRLDLGLTGTHLGCEHGVCGACTVQVDGAPVRGCLMLAVQANGKQITTVEGLASNDKLHPLQEAFWEHHGLQCGFCTPGILMTLENYLKNNPEPSETGIREALTGNICRCTGYQAIVKAALAAVKNLTKKPEVA